MKFLAGFVCGGLSLFAWAWCAMYWDGHTYTIQAPDNRWENCSKLMRSDSFVSFNHDGKRIRVYGNFTVEQEAQ